jgi:hypothetical protein
MPAGTLLGIGTGIVGAVGKMIQRGKNNKMLNSLLAKDPNYKENPIAAQRLSLAQTLLNARMPGAARAERNIYGSQANSVGNILRTATDSSQAMAMEAAINGQTDNAFGNLQDQEVQDYQRKYGNLIGAQEGMINEGDKVFNDNVRRFGNETQIRGAQAQNKQDNWGDISNLGFGIADFGMNGGFNNMFKKRQQSTPKVY